MLALRSTVDQRGGLMLARIAQYVIGSATLRPLVARAWYELLSAKARSSDWNFMNYGYVPAGGDGPVLDARDEADRLSIQLYLRVIGDAEMRGARVLEVGCGRGGGVSYAARRFAGCHVVGVDVAGSAVDLCRRQHAAVTNAEFMKASADHLPFPDGSFDVVINVESSHCYGEVDAFLREASRVLRTGGHFLFADFRSPDALRDLEAMLDAQSEWTRVASEDVTSGVIAALVASDPQKRQWIGKLKPQLRGVAMEFAGVVGSEMHRRFCAHELIYARYAYRRLP
jgi:ubiquinone/menaquinone biosynthesis C-methylase UbiE